MMDTKAKSSLIVTPQPIEARKVVNECWALAVSMCVEVPEEARTQATQAVFQGLWTTQWGMTVQMAMAQAQQMARGGPMLIG